STTMDAVAAADSAKPKLAAISLSHMISPMIPKHREWRGSAREELTTANNPTTPATPARRTEGSVPTRIINPHRARPATTACTRGPRLIQRHSKKKAVSTMATLAPDTAEKCERPL